MDKTYDDRKCLMNIQLLLNEDGTVCFGLIDTKINAKFSITKDTLTLQLKDLPFCAGLYSDKPYTFETHATEDIPRKNM